MRAAIERGRQILFNYTDDIRECPHSVYRVSKESRPSVQQPVRTPAINIDMHGNEIMFGHT